MKNFLFISLTVSVFLILSCSKTEPQQETVFEFCDDNYAEYQYNNSGFATEYTPGGGEITTPDGENCGISGVLDEGANMFLLKVFNEGQSLTLRFEPAGINEQGEFLFVQYSNSDMDSTFDQLSSDYQNYILIEEYNDVENTIRGQFDFTVENEMGESIVINNGIFDCSFHRF